MSDHVLGDLDIVVYLAVVDLEDHSNKVWQDCCTPRLGPYRPDLFTGLCSRDWKTEEYETGAPEWVTSMLTVQCAVLVFVSHRFEAR